MATPMLTGYFRYTDIWFEWHHALPDPHDRGPLKAILAHDALTHSHHPLRKEGEEGIALFMGTLLSGESRLLFSSAQVDYIRYWLHAMGLTKNIIPMPYSDCLLTTSSLKVVSPVTYKDGGSLRNALKAIEKNNKRLKGTNPTLNSRRHLFERVRTFWAEKIGVWCAMDFEAWDRDHSLLTEFGWSLVRWEDGEEVEEKGHLVVSERRGYRSTFVSQWPDNYNFGKSEDVNKTTFKARIQNLISQSRDNGPLFLIFHDNNQDIKYLSSKAVQAPIAGLTHVLPDTIPGEGIFAIDTADLFAALEGEGGGSKRSLQQVCRLLQIPTSFLHNAGNDAHYTLLSMKSMAKGDPLDLQREKRWPSETGTTGSNGVKVQFAPWAEDSDLSDMEGIMPPINGYDPITGKLREMDSV